MLDGWVRFRLLNGRIRFEFIFKFLPTLTLVGSRKFAVVNSAGSGVPIGRFPEKITADSRTESLVCSEILPSAIPTIAVMCVSGPKTCMGTPNEAPTSRITRNPS